MENQFRKLRGFSTPLTDMENGVLNRTAIRRYILFSLFYDLQGIIHFDAEVHVT